MDIAVTKEDSCAIMSLSGRMDATTSVDFDSCVQAVLNEGNKNIVIDMNDLVYISSAGLRSLLTLAKKIKSLPGHLCFCRLQPMVAEVFRISGFDKILSVYEDQNKALVALGG